MVVNMLRKALVFFSLLAGCTTVNGAWPFAPPDPGQSFAQDHVMVRFHTNRVASRFGRVTDVKLRDAEVALGLPAGAGLADTGYGRWLRAARGADPAAISLDRPVYVSVPRGLTAESLVEALRANPAVEYAETDGIGTGGATVPTDPNFTSQWHHLNTVWTNNPRPADIRSTLAWDITQGSTGVIVAILDTGLNTNLSEFAGRHVNGYDFANGDSNPADDHDHGTAVASVLGANANNGSLIAGVDWNCRIMPVKVLNSGNSGLYSWWADGIAWAVANGADVINLSAGGTTADTTLSNAIMNAIAQGVIFVTITHNDGGAVRFPGRMEACLTVGATTTNDQRASFSNYGSAIDLVAPGHNMTLVSRTGALLTGWYGTSFSAPQVAGVAALLRSLRPDLTHAQACKLLTAGADDRVGKVAEDVAGFDQYHGWGRLNAYNTLILAGIRVEPILGEDVPGLSWSSPPNASNREPYVVERSGTVTGDFAAVSSLEQFQYGTNVVLWQSSSPLQDSDFYRVAVTNR